MKQFKLTIDRFDTNNPEQIKKYSIVHTNKQKLLAKGRYYFLFGYRIGFHLEYNKKLMEIL